MLKQNTGDYILSEHTTADHTTGQIKTTTKNIPGDKVSIY